MKKYFIFLIISLAAISCSMREMEPITYRPVNQYDAFNLSWDDIPENYYYQPDGGLIILNDTTFTVFNGCVDIMFMDCDRFREQTIFCAPPGVQYDALGMLQHIYDYWSIEHDNISVWIWSESGYDWDQHVHLGFIRK